MRTVAVLPFGTSQIELRIGEYDDKEERFVVYDGEEFRELSELFKNIPELASPLYAASAAQIVNFILMGRGLDVISDPNKFRTQYQKRVAEEEKAFDNQKYRTVSYGKYNVAAVDVPKWEEQSLIFYAINNVTGVPYQVVFCFSEDAKTGDCNYRLLPFLSKE